MLIDDLRHAAERRLAEIEAEAVHLRALVVLYGGGDRAIRADAQPSLKPSRPQRIRVPTDAMPFLRFMAERHGDVHMDEMEAFARERGIEFDRNRLRQHMHNWKNRDLVSNPAQSVFRLTLLGADTLLSVSGDQDHEDAERDDAPKRNEAPNGQARGASEAGEDQDASTSASLWSQS